MERVKFKSFGLGSPCFADELVGGEAFEGLEPSGEVVGVDEVPQMRAQLVVGLVEGAFDGGVLDRPVHSLDLTIRPWMLRLRQPVIDIVEGAGIFEGMRSEGLLLGDHLPDFHRRPGVASGIGEVGCVVGKDRVDLVRAASISRRRKSAGSRRQTVSRSSTKANFEVLSIATRR